MHYKSCIHLENVAMENLHWNTKTATHVHTRMTSTREEKSHVSLVGVADTSRICVMLTLGAQLKCIPGTGRMVIDMVTQRYKYKVPRRKK